MGNNASIDPKTIRELRKSISENRPIVTTPQQMEAINKKLEDFMEEKCLKEEARVKMRAMPLDMKLKILFLKTEDMNKDEDTTSKVKQLQTESMTAQELSSLRVAISGQGKKWLELFIQKQGLHYLFAYLNREIFVDLKLEVLRCVKAFLNNNYGMKAIMEKSELLETLCSQLAAEDSLRNAALELLIAICWTSDEGHGLVLDSLSNVFATPFVSRFRHMIDSLQNSENVELKNNIMTLSNALINGINSLEGRVELRQEFVEQGIVAIIAAVRKWIEIKRTTTPNLLVYQQLLAQLDVFEYQMANDRRETHHGNLDLSDVDELMAFLKEWTVKGNVSNHLLGIMQRLVAIPNNLLGFKLWRNCDEVLKYAVVTKLENSEEIPAHTYDWLKGELVRREQEDAIEEKNLQLMVEQLQAKDASNITEIQRLKEEVGKLQQQLTQTLAALNTMKLAAAAAAAAAATAAAPTAPDAPAIAPPAPPPMDVPPIPPPIDAPPMAPSFDGPPPPPSAPILPPTPKLPPKKVIKPSVKMRVLHWNVVQPSQIDNTVWKQLSDEGIKFDTKSFEEKFREPPKGGMGGGGGGGGGGGSGEGDRNASSSGAKGLENKEKKQVTVELLDGKRSNNINILLARFKMTPVAIRDAILSMDEKLLTEEKVTALLKCAPTDDELEAIKSYDGDEENLGSAEKLFFTIKRIPRMDRRLECFLFKLRFGTLIAEVEGALKMCENAVQTLKENKNYLRVLEYILALGNYLNGGTKKGGAYGFKLDTIGKLKNTRSVNGKLNLLHFLAMTVKQSSPESRNFVEQFQVVTEATRVDTTGLTSEINKIKALISKTESELKQSDQRPNNDLFVPVMSQFVEIATQKSSSLDDRIKILDQKTGELCNFFGEEKMKLEELCKIFSDFANDFKESEFQLEKMRKEEEEEAKRAFKRQSTMEHAEKEKEKERENNKEEKNEEKNKAGAVDKVVSSLKVTDANEIMKMIQQRRKKTVEKDISARKKSGNPAPVHHRLGTRTNLKKFF